MIGPLLTSLAVAAGAPIEWRDLGLDPVALDLGVWQLFGLSVHPVLRWYSLAYLAGILIGWRYLMKLIARPGAPMARRHADDMVFYATLGIILGGRLGYVLFYRPEFYFHDPVQILRIWDGGMSFHGGVIGTTLGILWMARKHKLDWLRVHDYVACCAPFGIFLVRLANFVNGELWGRPTDVPWAIVFPSGGDVPRHPSQLYEAGLEGLLLFFILWFLFWKTDARYRPGQLVGAFLLGYGLSRFAVEFFRQPDEHLTAFAVETGLSMGQWLTLPMILGGLYLVGTASGRQKRALAAEADKCDA